MSPSDILPSNGFTETSASTRFSLKGRRVSRRSGGLRSSCNSAKLSRTSSTSRSIKIFADIKDLLGLPRDSHIRIPDDPESNQGHRNSSNNSITTPKTEVAEQSSPSQDPHVLEKNQEKDAESPVGSGQQLITPGTPSSGEEINMDDPESPFLYDDFPQPPSQVFRSNHRSVSIRHDTLNSTLESPDNAGSNTSEKRPPRIDKLLPQPPYHSFTPKKKIMVVTLISLAGSLSALSSIIYFPALNVVAADFHVSKELVLLTITAFMLVQGITPVLRTPFENVGRRPMLIGTLSVFCGASIGLVFTRRFSVHFILRAVQAGGSSALTTIGAAVVDDISTGREKDNLMRIFGTVLIMSHFISPVIGGTLTDFLGFRSIFWVIFIFGATIMVLIILALPETLRSIAGNGTVKLGHIHRPLWSILKSRDTPFNPSPDARTYRPSLAALTEPLSCLRQGNIVASILFGSIVYGVWTTVISTTTLLFQERFHLSTFLVGVAFLPSGAGTALSFYLTGIIMDRDYRIVELQYRDKHNMDQNSSLDPKSLPDFPIYRARLRSLWWIALVFIATTAGYGFSFLSPSVAVPLVLQFIIASSATAVLFLDGVLVADTYPGCSSPVIAVMNMIRFSCGALAVGTVQLLFNRLGYGFTFLTLSMIVVAVLPILLVQWVFGSGRGSDHSTWWQWPARFKNFDS